MQRSTLTRDFLNVMTAHNAAQVKFRERLKNKFKRQLEIGTLPNASHYLANEG